MSKRKAKQEDGKGTAESLEARLGKLRLFAGMSEKEIADVIRQLGGTVRCFAKDEIVVYEGTKAKWVVPVLSGRLTVFESGASGVRHPVRVVEAGRLFGATMVTANLEYYPGMAVAAEPSEVIFLDIAQIKALWRQCSHPKLFERRLPRAFRRRELVPCPGERHACPGRCGRHDAMERGLRRRRAQGHGPLPVGAGGAGRRHSDGRGRDGRSLDGQGQACVTGGKRPCQADAERRRRLEVDVRTAAGRERRRGAVPRHRDGNEKGRTFTGLHGLRAVRPIAKTRRR